MHHNNAEQHEHLERLRRHLNRRHGLRAAIVHVDGDVAYLAADGPYEIVNVTGGYDVWSRSPQGIVATDVSLDVAAAYLTAGR